MRPLSPTITSMGRLADLTTTLIGLSLGFHEMNLVALTTLGFIAGGASVLLLFLGEYLAARLGINPRIIPLICLVTWAPALWNLAMILTSLKY